jgi:hypothetical protein
MNVSQFGQVPRQMLRPQQAAPRMLFRLHVKLGGNKGVVHLKIYEGAVPEVVARQFGVKYGLNRESMICLTKAITAHYIYMVQKRRQVPPLGGPNHPTERAAPRLASDPRQASESNDAGAFAAAAQNIGLPGVLGDVADELSSMPDNGAAPTVGSKRPHFFPNARRQGDDWLQPAQRTPNFAGNGYEPPAASFQVGGQGGGATKAHGGKTTTMVMSFQELVMSCRYVQQIRKANEEKSRKRQASS